MKYWWKLLFARMGLCIGETNLARMGLCIGETNLARMGLCVSKVLVYRILARMVEYMSEVLVETFIRKNGSVCE